MNGHGKTQTTDGGQAVDEKIEAALSRIRHNLLVMSGKGGVGKSSVTAGLGLRLAARGKKVGLVDVDIHGPSLAGILGLEGLLDITPEQRVKPKPVNSNLKAVSMQSLMRDADLAVIWRGPVKTGLIHQFIGDVEWGDLDYLILDAPPGTGDEPLSVAQTVRSAQAVIVTTPQDVALSDVRKSINFCRTIDMRILGLIENMGPFACPCCGKSIPLFKSGGGQVTAEQMDVPLLGTLPFDPEVVKACDTGLPKAPAAGGPAYLSAMDNIVDSIIRSLES